MLSANSPITSQFHKAFLLGMDVLGLTCVSGVAIWAIYWKFKKQSLSRGMRFPPGPKPLPLVGNLFDQPHENAWSVYDSWSKEYGDVMSIDVLGKRIVILNSAKAISEFLDTRSSNYSDRAHLPMLNELVGWNWNFCFMNRGPKWRDRRRVFNRYFNSSNIRSLFPIQNKHSKFLLQQLLQSPKEFNSHLRQNQTASIIEGVYAQEIKDKNDPFIDVAENALLSLSIAGEFGTFYVDILPFLKYIPSWFPGAHFQRKAAEWRSYVHALKADTFEELKEKMLLGTARPCIAKSMLDDAATDDYDAIEAIQDAAGIAFGAGADTSVATSLVFFLAMIMNPEAQARAQNEIDSVVGRDRLPDFSDQPNLPYINALCKEVMRWQNVTPLLVSHAATEDDVYEGFFIPKGSVIVPNAWAVLHDPEVYPEPKRFLPDRFLKDNQLDPEVLDPHAFMFGRGHRICPGRYFALNSLYSIVSNVLACFNIEPPPNGPPTEPKMTSGVISFPEALDVVITPRYEGVDVLIENAVMDTREVL